MERFEHPNLHPDIIERINKSRKDGGVVLNKIAPGTLLDVKTTSSNDNYEIIVLTPVDDAPYNVRIRGGQYFPEWSFANIHGSTWGTPMLKKGWVGIGMRMEITSKVFEDKTLTTSMIEQIKIYGDGYIYTLEAEKE